MPGEGEVGVEPLKITQIDGLGGNGLTWIEGLIDSPGAAKLAWERKVKW
jgi:hypothetical protein